MNRIYLIGLATLLILSSPASAAEKFWVGSTTSSNWFEAENWQPPGVPAPEDAVTVTNGTIQVAADINIAALTFTSGRIINSNSIIVTNFSWGEVSPPGTFTSAAFDGAGRVVVPAEGTLLFSGDSSRRLTTGRLENFGQAIIGNGRSILLFSGAVFHNAGTLIITTNFNFDGANGPPGGVLTNSGTLIVTGQIARVQLISVRFDNTGTTLLRNGVFACGSGSSSGTVDISLTATQSTVSTFTYHSGANFPGPGLLHHIRGTMSAGTNDLVLPNFLLDIGTLTGSNTFVVSNFTWIGGAIAGQGLFRIPPGGSLVVTGGSGFKTLGRELRNEGIGFRSGGTDVSIQSTGRFHNVGTFFAGRGYWLGSPSRGFYNSGTLVTTGLLSETTFYTPFTNAGRVRVEDSFLRTLFGYHQIAGSTELAGGELRSDTVCVIRAGKLSGSGRVGFSLINYGELHPGNPIGALIIPGHFTNFGRVFIDMDDLGYNDQINVGFHANLRGAMYLCLRGAVPSSPFIVLNYASYTNTFQPIHGLPINEGRELVPTYGATSLRFSMQPGPPPVPNRLAALPCADGIVQVRAIVAANRSYEIQSSTNLADWALIFTTNNPPNGFISFFDSDASAHPQRYYRLLQIAE